MQNPVNYRLQFSQKNAILDVWQGSKYAFD